MENLNRFLDRLMRPPGGSSGAPLAPRPAAGRSIRSDCARENLHREPAIRQHLDAAVFVFAGPLIDQPLAIGAEHGQAVHPADGAAPHSGHQRHFAISFGALELEPERVIFPGALLAASGKPELHRTFGDARQGGGG